MTIGTLATDMLGHARTLATAATHGASERLQQSRLVCRAAVHLCAIPLEHVAEIMRALPIEVLAARHDMCAAYASFAETRCRSLIPASALEKRQEVENREQGCGRA